MTRAQRLQELIDEIEALKKERETIEKGPARLELDLHIKREREKSHG